MQEQNPWHSRFKLAFVPAHVWGFNWAEQKQKNPWHARFKLAFVRAHVWGFNRAECEEDSSWDHTIMTDAHWLVKNPGTAAMTVTVPGTQKTVAVCPPGSQSVAGFLLHVFLIVVHGSIVASRPVLHSKVKNEC